MIILKCRNCPYVLYEFNNRLRHHQKVLTDFERKYPGLKFPDPWYYQPQNKILNAIERACYCQKYDMAVGHLKAYGNPCEEVFQELIQQKNHNKQKRRNKRERDQKHKNHLKFLAENRSGYPCPAIYTDEIWVKGQYVENPKPYYKRLYRGKGRHSNSNYHKKMSNRKIRRYKGELPKKGNLSHRLYDFWWQMC